jgi:hypothetical protein
VAYAWSGCASGTAKTATCVIERPGDVTVSVRVTDGLGQVADGGATATGTNRPPVPWISDRVLWESWTPSLGAGSFEVDAQVVEPDPALIGNCGGIRDPRWVTASGICYGGYFRCWPGAMDVGALKNAPSGECSLTLTAQDEWGASASVTKTFRLPHK